MTPHSMPQLPAARNTMGVMFSMQEELMKEFQKLEGFPDWPLNLDIKENQTLLKKFGYRFIEELGEAFEQLILEFQAASTNHYNEAKQACRDFNSELGDSLAFFMELMIFSGIGEEEIKQWMDGFKNDNLGFGSMLDEGDIIQSLLRYGFYKNQHEGKQFDPYNMFDAMPMMDILRNNNFEWLGARRINESFCNDVSQFLWWITYSLTQALNKLKMRDWNQAERVSNVVAYQQGLMDTFILYFQFMHYIEKNEQSIYCSYYLVHNKNMTRIKGGY